MNANAVAREIAKDNQWWFSKSPLRATVESHRIIELIIEGRRCLLERSSTGNDGRLTWSFKFVRDDDRRFWQSLNQNLITIEFAASFESLPDAKDEGFNTRIETKQVSGQVAKGIIPTDSRVDTPKLGLHIPIFDAYVFIDWSASNSRNTGTDSIWISEARWNNKDLVWMSKDNGAYNAPTREDATTFLFSVLESHRKENLRTLICFDFPYGYPDCEESRTIGKDQDAIARRLSAMLKDDEKNRSNRFEVANELNQAINQVSEEGPFWGRPPAEWSKNLKRLQPTKPRDWSSRSTLKEYRVVESRLKRNGMRAFSVWQLFGNGSVGSQVLVGLPRVLELRLAQEFRECSVIWPFETGWTTGFEDKIKIVHAEFWPGAIPFDASLHSVRDAAQVKSSVIWAAREDASGSLGSYFDPLSESDPDRDIAIQEGWILGFKDIDR